MSALPEYLQQSWPVERQLPRYRANSPLRVLIPGGVSVEGTCVDVSEGGLGALTQTKIEEGRDVVLELHLPESEAPLIFKAIVRHSGSDRSGFEFQTITPEQRQLIRTYGLRISMKKRPRLV
jgi:c-di-GMP-binding flagellar brake protein YcgR